MSKSLLDNLLDSIFDADWVGKRGEKLTERELKLVDLFGRKGLTLRNVYLPKENGETSEIELFFENGFSYSTYNNLDHYKDYLDDYPQTKTIYKIRSAIIKEVRRELRKRNAGKQATDYI